MADFLLDVVVVGSEEEGCLVEQVRVVDNLGDLVLGACAYVGQYPANLTADVLLGVVQQLLEELQPPYLQNYLGLLLVAS